MTSGVRCMVMRGGTSKGAFFAVSDLPANIAERDELLMAIMGTPDARQIDGIGGAHPLTSKVAVVGPSDVQHADLDYLFLQVGVDQAFVTDRQNCGNLLSAVGPFAVERGFLTPPDGEVELRIRLRNTGGMAIARFEVRSGLPVYEGDKAISGVPGTAAEISIEFEGIAGSSCGSLLPTGNSVDVIEGVPATLVDNGMPVVVLAAAALGATGYETCAELEDMADLRARLESIRLQAGPVMGLGDVAETTVPKMSLVAAPKDGGTVAVRTFNPHRCHPAIGVLGAISVATACRLETGPGADVSAPTESPTVTIEHPTGTFETLLEMKEGTVTRAGIVRTARKLMDGTVFPRSY